MNTKIMLDNCYPYLTEITVESTNSHSGNFLKVMNDKVKLPDGSLANREWVKFGKASAIIAINNNNEIILERQYRHPVNRVMIEIPAGKTEKSESPLDSAKRELQEETGFHTEKWSYLGTCLPCIGYSNEEITYFLAENIQPGQQNLDKGEFLEIFTLPLNNFFELIYNNIIIDSKTITGAMLYLGHRNR